MAVAVQGKGFFIWKIPSCEGGNAQAIATQAQVAGLNFVVIKIADGTRPMNYDTARSVDLIPPVALALKAAGIQVWGWHYVYGYDPLGEARKAIQRMQALNLDGYVIDAEAEYKQAGKDKAARQYLAELRSAYPSLPIGLSSYRFPSYHKDFPWQAFLDGIDYHMPQVYWEQAHNAGTQLTRTVQEFQAMTPYRPVLPTGPGYKTGGWAPTEADTKEFLSTALSLGLPTVSFFSWDECRRDLPKIWTTIGDFNYQGAASTGQDVAGKLIDALNQRNLDQAVSLYNPNAVQITSSRTIQGQDAIKTWYASLLNQLPASTFTLTGLSGTGNSRHFTWQATSTRGAIHNGSDTLGLVDGKINYHYSFFTISPN
ncbi:MAG TPA: nuclear transport factor 2 family protein [Anaerolineaceae bacterium]|jgi:hypothetical protein